MHINRRTSKTSSLKTRPIRAGIVLFLVLLGLFNANMSEIGSGDTITLIYSARNLATSGNIYLDREAWDLLNTPMAYSISKQGDHWVTNYPILPALFALPAMVALNFLGILYEQTALDAGKFTASILVAFSGVFLWLALRKKTTELRAIGFTLIYAAATSSWSTSSQSLWQHALSQFFCAWLVWLFSTRTDEKGMLPWAGLACGLLVCGRPADVWIAALAAFYVVLKYRQSAWRFFPGPIVCASALLIYNQSIFGNPLGGYAILNGPDAAAYFNYFSPEFPVHLAAILVSPNRGLFAYSPILIFAFWGMIRWWRQEDNKLTSPEGFFLAAILIFLVQMGAYGWWTGGHCYGYRILTDILPFICFFFYRLPEKILAKKMIGLLFITCLGWSVFVQYVGAFHYPGGGWNSQPVNIIQDRSRVWDIADLQIIREWRVPPKTRVLRVLGRITGNRTDR